jgi:hypothetical protein
VRPPWRRLDHALGSRLRRWAPRLALTLMLLGQAAAQEPGWSVQTVALRDLIQAQELAAGLRAAGYPAFTEFVMSDGLQYIRVRVGCWSAREGAEAVAEMLLRGGHAREAVVVPHGEDSPWGCTEVDVGFLTPATWTALHDDDHLPTFRVELAGHVGHLRHDGERWLVMQGEDAPAPIAITTLQWPYLNGVLGGGAAVFDDRGASPLLVCPGRLIGQVGEVMVVAWEDAVVACRPAPVPPASPEAP